MLNIDEPHDYRIALHHLGFRPFFLLAGLAAGALMAAWALVYLLDQSLPQTERLPASWWHGHEMIFGYAMAVIAGFLLTAVRNWTGVQTLHGWPLLALAVLWLLARLMPFIAHPDALGAMMVLDLAFGVGLVAALLVPIVKVRQWKHLLLWLLVVLLVAANALFYAGLFVGDDTMFLVQRALLGGLYLIVALILLMGRRVIPFFIEKGVGEGPPPRNHAWLDLTVSLLLVAFILLEVFDLLPGLLAVLALALAVLHSVRLAGWHHPGIWSRPLLWILFVAYAWIIIGFALRAIDVFYPLNPYLFMHAFAAGGIGLMTLGMMARVALGHTGRNVFDPPRVLGWMFGLAVAASLVRVIPALFTTRYYEVWIGISQGLWIAAFSWFFVLYAPMLIKPRVDGRYG
ncbi:MAG TPA: NnrS family protein [Gammaproteobacteria bacterium]|nr:NnrS family protein [Gammaproteobacteria bacterium]